MIEIGVLFLDGLEPTSLQCRLLGVANLRLDLPLEIGCIWSAWQRNNAVVLEHLGVERVEVGAEDLRISGRSTPSLKIVESDLKRLGATELRECVFVQLAPDLARRFPDDPPKCTTAVARLHYEQPWPAIFSGNVTFTDDCYECIGGAGVSHILASAGDCLTCDLAWISIQGIQVQDVESHPPATPPPTPTPGINIFDSNLKLVVTNTTQTALVGQQQALDAVPTQPTISLNSCSWTIAGNRSRGANSLVSTPSPAPTGSPQTSFFWTGSGSNSASANDGVSVKCVSSPSGANLTASATYTVYQPTISMTTVTGTVQVAPYPTAPATTIPALAFGLNTYSTSGIHFTFKATAPTNGSGNLGVAQIITTMQSAMPTTCFSPLYNGTYRDADFPYPVGSETSIGGGAQATWMSNSP